VSIEWRGMSEFIQALKSAPVEITNEADASLKEIAAGMATDVRAQYRRVSSTFLKGQVRTKKLQKMAHRVSVGGSGHIYELGTAVRHTKAGANRGQAPARGPIFFPARQKAAARMEGQMRAIAMKSRARSTTSGLL
jgi:hypothetical protein